MGRRCRIVSSWGQPWRAGGRSRGRVAVGCGRPTGAVDDAGGDLSARRDRVDGARRGPATGSAQRARPPPRRRGGQVRGHALVALGQARARPRRASSARPAHAARPPRRGTGPPRAPAPRRSRPRRARRARASAASAIESLSPGSATPATTASAGASGSPARHNIRTSSPDPRHHCRSRYSAHSAPGRLTGSASLPQRGERVQPDLVGQFDEPPAVGRSRARGRPATSSAAVAAATSCARGRRTLPRPRRSGPSGPRAAPAGAGAAAVRRRVRLSPSPPRLRRAARGSCAVVAPPATRREPGTVDSRRRPAHGPRSHICRHERPSAERRPGGSTSTSPDGASGVRSCPTSAPPVTGASPGDGNGWVRCRQGHRHWGASARPVCCSPTARGSRCSCGPSHARGRYVGAARRCPRQPRERRGRGAARGRRGGGARPRARHAVRDLGGRPRRLVLHDRPRPAARSRSSCAARTSRATTSRGSTLRRGRRPAAAFRLRRRVAAPARPRSTPARTADADPAAARARPSTPADGAARSSGATPTRRWARPRERALDGARPARSPAPTPLTPCCCPPASEPTRSP